MSSRSLTGLLFASLAANVVLVVAVLLLWQSDPPLAVTLVRPPMVTNLYQPLRTNVIVQARSLRWRDIESTNYFTYIANLRSFGCPEPTIRDLITAEINELFADRRAREVVTPSHQWWRADPDPDLARLAELQAEDLDRERRGLLDRLLGSASASELAETHREPTTTPLDGPILGLLPAETRVRVREIEQEYRAGLLALSQGDPTSPPTPPDLAERDRLEAEARAELATVLAPEQLEEYLLRYSRTAAQLRQQTREFEPTREEFYALFKAIDPLQQQLVAAGNDSSEAAEKRRVELLALREAAIEDALKPERYASYRLNQDPAFVAVRETVKELNLPENQALPIYQINQATREEQERILNDSSLSSEQQTAQLAAIEQQRLDTMRQLLGDAAFRRLHSASP